MQPVNEALLGKWLDWSLLELFGTLPGDLAESSQASQPPVDGEQGEGGGGIIATRKVLVDRYGNQGCRGVLFLSGRFCFRYLVDKFRHDLEFDVQAFRLLPTPRRLQQGLESLANVMVNNLGINVKLENDAECWTWRMDECPICKGFNDTLQTCPFFEGLLQEGMSWISGGKTYLLLPGGGERGENSGCVIRLRKQPVE